MVDIFSESLVGVTLFLSQRGIYIGSDERSLYLISRGDGKEREKVPYSSTL